MLFIEIISQEKVPNDSAFSLKHNEESVIRGHLLSPHSTLFTEKKAKQPLRRASF